MSSEIRKKSMTMPSNKAVSKFRLKQIEREHRSIGSMLDNRTIFDLEEVILPKVIPFDAHKFNLKEDRSNVSTDQKIVESSSESKLDHYKNEEMIWKSKSRAPNYIIKRKFENPELQKFHNNMTTQQKQLFNSKSQNAIVELSNKLRDDLVIEKNEMDNKGIFHPEANAHRVHCMYLLKLYRG